jgi:hypothetical protein
MTAVIGRRFGTQARGRPSLPAARWGTRSGEADTAEIEPRGSNSEQRANGDERRIRMYYGGGLIVLILIIILLLYLL